MSAKLLSVRLHGTPVAELEQLETGQMQLTYLPAASRALSLGLPLREQPYGDLPCEAYFGGLLPEGQEARKRLAERYKTSPRSTFGLLRAIGLDCAGAVSLHDPSDPVVVTDGFPMKAEPISERELAQHIRALPRKPLFMDVEGLRLSLAGAQDKAALCLIDGQLSIPVEGTPTTHILKPAIDKYEDIVFNEYVCLKLAGAIGIQVPTVAIGEAEGLTYLLVERYDRVVLPGARISRIHQEDFCQALGVISENKYQASQGPGLRDCFDLTLRFDKPAQARQDLAQRVIFNVLVGNCDAHAKNYSLMYPGGGKPILTPAYDILCTGYYDGLNTKMAMKVGRKYEAKELYAYQWQQFGQEVGLSFPMIRRTLSGVYEALMAAIARERQETAWPVIRPILDCIETGASGILRQFELSLPGLKDHVEAPDALEQP